MDRSTLKPTEENVVPLTPVRRPDPPGAPPSASAAPVLVPFPRWRKACERVGTALLGGETRIVVTGPPGTGKTLLLEHTARVLRAGGWTVVMRLAAAPPPPAPGRAVVLIDEADRLSGEALQRLLASAPGPLVLAGLETLLPLVPDAVQVSLGALSPEEARDFIASWLVLAGRTPENLGAAAMRRTIELSGGVPRLLATLLSAASWLAETSDATIITVPHIEEAAALRSCFAPELGEPAAAPERDATASAGLPITAIVATAMFLLGVAAFVATHFYPLEVQRAFSTSHRPAAASEPTPEPPQHQAEAAPAPAPPAPSPHPAPEPALAPQLAAAAETQAVEPPPEAPAVASAAPLEPSRPVLPGPVIGLLLQRGQGMMAIGDIVAARLLFGRAAETGNAEAMLDMGKTYDPAILATASPLLEPHPAEARHWYRQALEAGNKEAADRLQALGPTATQP